MNTRRRYLLLAGVVSLTVVCICVSCRKSGDVAQYTSVPQGARISPDYSDTVIPPNIAPLNFRVLEAGEKFFVRIYASNGRPITIQSRNGDIKIPIKPWRKLLSENKGSQFFFDIFVYETGKGWRRYQPISNTIANEKIDSWLVFRFIRPIYTEWNSVGIYQRNIENYKNSLVFHGQLFGGGCINCHTFWRNCPEKMTIGTRSKDYGNTVLMYSDNKVSKIGAAWGYTAWHPSGKLAAYSMNKIRQTFHTTQIENRDVVDFDSAILYYVLESQTTKTTPALSRKDRLETYPAWSGDGKYLYYCSAPMLWDRQGKILPEDYYNQVKYDLMRISYDVQKDVWGEPEMVLSAKETNMSILLPRISPDGKFLVFTMCDYGSFPIYRSSSDLYIMNLETREYKRLDVINSPYSESWHSWSSNSRWLAFSSRKYAGPFTRTYFTYIDESGVAHKPFILPQKDPRYYDSLLQTYSVPELITEPVRVSPGSLARAARSDEKISVNLPITGATVKTETSDPYEQHN
jgi:hypothetical protein